MSAKVKHIAYCGVPHAGGTYSFYIKLKRGLLPYGWKVSCVAAGRQDKSIWDESVAEDGCVLLAPDASSPLEQAKHFVKWVEANNVDIVFPGSNLAMQAAVPHLPPEVRVVSRCNCITRMTYALAVANLYRLHRVFVLSRRQFLDLSSSWRVPGERLALVPNGVELSRFADSSGNARPPRDNQVIRLVYLGRIEDYDKGVFLLPKIVSQLARERVPFILDIIGDGPDREELKKRFRSLPSSANNVFFLGKCKNDEVARLLVNNDVAIHPSRFDSSPNALLEVMAAGCVPVASRISGVTDFIIEDGKEGLLCPVGGFRSFAKAIASLHRNRRTLAEMSQAARLKIERNFSLGQMAASYDRELRRVLEEEPLADGARAWSEFRIPRILRKTWRTKVPLPVKNFARKWMVRLGVGAG